MAAHQALWKAWNGRMEDNSMTVSSNFVSVEGEGQGCLRWNVFFKSHSSMVTELGLQFRPQLQPLVYNRTLIKTTKSMWISESTVQWNWWGQIFRILKIVDSRNNLIRQEVLILCIKNETAYNIQHTIKSCISIYLWCHRLETRACIMTYQAVWFLDILKL